MNRQQTIAEVLADGEFHSGQDIANALGISRTAVWKQIQTLDKFGIDIFSVRGKGYRMASAIELLDIETINNSLSGASREKIRQLDVLFDTDSTNTQVSNRSGQGGIHGQVLFAEYQSEGRGRRGRQWISPLGSGICLSIGWRFDPQPESISLLPLAAGVATINALRKNGIDETYLKWPNDIILDNGKLGGILLENRSEMGGFFDVILGVGLNYSLGSNTVNEIDQKVSDICSSSPGNISRNQLAASLLDELVLMLDGFSVELFSGFIQQWNQYDCMRGKEASLLTPNETYTGRIMGVNNNGMLVMKINGREVEFNNGELSLRLMS